MTKLCYLSQYYRMHLKLLTLSTHKKNFWNTYILNLCVKSTLFYILQYYQVYTNTIPLDFIKLQHYPLPFLHQSTFITLLSSNHNLQNHTAISIQILLSYCSIITNEWNFQDKGKHRGNIRWQTFLWSK